MPQKTTHKTQDNKDNAWKDIMVAYLEPAMKLCFPEVHKAVDWSQDPIFLDQELRAITKGGHIGTKYVDLIVKVHLKNGSTVCIVLLIEIQHTKDKAFPERVFIYVVRSYDKLRFPVLPCIILADPSKDWRPKQFDVGALGHKVLVEFETCKIIDFESKREMLEKSDNIFATAILLQLDALKLKGKKDEVRRVTKISLAKKLLQKGCEREDVHNFLRFIDFLIGLKPESEVEYKKEVHKFSEVSRMPYLSGFERDAMQQGIQQVARNFLNSGFDPATVAKNTGLDRATIEKLKEETRRKP